MASSGKSKVAYFYDKEVGNFYYGQGHPMKPHRMRMTHDLLHHYDLLKEMEVMRPERTPSEDLTMFHSDEYIEFLRLITPDNQHEHMRQLKRFNVGEDCPVFDGVFQFCQISAGGSIGGAVRLNNKTNDIVINWSGGLHHAKKNEASGFCYVNDIVLAILELLKVHNRVLYIDIDIHHGDGVEEAFYTTDRVMTVSFHKFGEYFPGTGHLADVGHGEGKYYAINVPLKDGIDDTSYNELFKPLMQKVMEMYQPDAIVLQGGADSLSGDRLGCFNLSIRGHAECVRFMKSFGVPLLMVGGGGYTIRNVARCWCYETGVLVGTELDDRLPQNEYYEYFGPSYRLHMQASNMENQNTNEYLNTVRTRLLDNLSKISPAPSVPFHNVPPESARIAAEAEAAERAEDEKDPDVRISLKDSDKRVRGVEGDMSDSEDEGEDGHPRRRDLAYSKEDTGVSHRESVELKADLEGAPSPASNEAVPMDADEAPQAVGTDNGHQHMAMDGDLAPQ